MGPPPFPLATGIAVPLTFIIPTSILLYTLHHRLQKEQHPPEKVSDSGNGHLRTRNQSAAASKGSLASLDVRPFLDGPQQVQITTRTEEYVPPPTISHGDRAMRLPVQERSALFSYALSILLSLTCGLVYLACATSATPSPAIDFPLGISTLVVPFLVLPHSIEGIFKRSRTPLVEAGRQRRLLRRIVLPLLASIAVAALGAWVSTYIIVAALLVSLLSISFLALDTSKWPLPLLEPRTETTNRHTKSWFSGNGLSEADAEALARQGNMPRPGETEDAFLERMQHEGNSWITETGGFHQRNDKKVMLTVLYDHREGQRITNASNLLLRIHHYLRTRHSCYAYDSTERLYSARLHCFSSNGRFQLWKERQGPYDRFQYQFMDHRAYGKRDDDEFLQVRLQ